MSNASASTAEIDAVITPEVRAWIGRTTELLPLPEAVSASDIRRYVEATGDRNPLWLDDAAAQAAGYRSRLLPPMMVIDLSWRVKNNDNGRLWQDIPLPPAYIDTRNASTEIEWLESVHIGDHLALRHRINDIVAKQGRRGLGVYISKQTEYRVLGRGVAAIVRQTVVRFPSERVEKH